MFDFENKPVGDWTLAEAKEYCLSHVVNPGCYFNKNCILHNSCSCTNVFANMKLKDNTIPQFSPDEIAFCRLIKKTIPWAKYIARSSVILAYLELQPVFADKSYFKTESIGFYTTLDSKFFPQIKPLTYYAIDDIIKQGENNLD